MQQNIKAEIDFSYSRIKKTNNKSATKYDIQNTKEN